MKNNLDLDKINNERVEETHMRVAEVIKLLDNPIGCLLDGNLIDSAMTDIAKAINLLEAANQEMTYACKHFNWNDDICLQIDDACGKLGKCLAFILKKDNEDFDIEVAGYEGKDALNILGKVIATLIRWFEDDPEK